MRGGGGRGLLEALLSEIYRGNGAGGGGCSSASEDSSCSSWGPWAAAQPAGGLRAQLAALAAQVGVVGAHLGRQLRVRDSLRRRRDLRCDVVSAILRATAASKGYNTHLFYLNIWKEFNFSNIKVLFQQNCAVVNENKV